MRRFVLALLPALGGCGSAGSFGCQDDAQCGADGVCSAPGYCAFPDPGCDSGLAFGAHAGTLAGDCVPKAGGSGGGATDDGAGPGTGSAGSGSSPATGDGTTLAVDDGASGSGTATSDLTTGATRGDGPTTGDDGGETMPTAGTTADPQPFDVTWTADLALCAYPDNVEPAPDVCATSAVRNAFTVDLDETSGDLGSSVGYLAFAIGPEPSGGRVADVTLRLRVSDVSGANSDHGGEVWRVEAFDETTLAVATPAPIGVAPLAADPGAVALGADVEWPLPADVLVAGETLHLAVVPLSTNGVDYLDVGSASPPAVDATIAP